MPDKIYVTYTPTSFPDAFHTAIHYERRDADGGLVKHFMVEVQPEAKGQARRRRVSLKKRCGRATMSRASVE